MPLPHADWGSVMQRCSVHSGSVLDGDAVVLREVITGSGPGVLVYACHQCVRDRGLVPVRPRTATHVGHRDSAPSPAATP